MKKVLVVFIVSSLSIHAAYNPFFEEKPAPTSQEQVPKTIIKTIIKKEPIRTKSIPQRKNIEISYYGFIHTNKGKFALVSFQDKNIVIKINDSLYINEQIFKVNKITSNYILMQDRYNRTQTVYFSSKQRENS